MDSWRKAKEKREKKLARFGKKKKERKKMQKEEGAERGRRWITGPILMCWTLSGSALHIEVGENSRGLVTQ